MPPNIGRNIVADRRRQLVASLLARNPRITRRQIQAMLAKPTDQGGIRNPYTHRPYALGTIHADVMAVREEWRNLRLRSTQEWIEHELNTYEELELQAWRNNDLAEVRRVSAERRKLLGLDAPTKIASTTPDGAAPFPLNSISIFEHVDHTGQE